LGNKEKLRSHATESEDKTAAVVDVEAKLKNQTEFRDSLRRMLTKPGVSVADLLQIQEKLDGSAGGARQRATQRKVVANETKRCMSKSPFTPNSGRLAAAPSRRSAKRCGISAPSLATASPFSLPPSRPSFPG